MRQWHHQLSLEAHAARVLELEVFQRKHQAIRKATGVSVPVPDDSDSVVQAVIEGLLLRGRDYAADQLTLDLGGIAEAQRGSLTDLDRTTLAAMRKTWQHAMAQPMLWGETAR